MAWSDFTITVDDVQAHKPDILHLISPERLTNYMTRAQANVEDILLRLIYTKMKKANKVIPDDLPDEPLDLYLAAAYPQIRDKIVFRTIYFVFREENPEFAEVWQKEYDSTDLNEAYIYIDVDESGEIESDEHYNIREEIDRRQR